MIVGDITNYLESRFPLNTALDHDNVGLQVGNKSAICDRIFVALTLTDDSLRQAIASQTKLIITHHPLIYRPLSSLDVATPLGKRLHTLMSQGISLYSAHTNLDVAEGGVSDALADVYGLRDRQILQVTHEQKLLKLVVYVPVEAFEVFREKFLASKVGHIGNYSHCSFSLDGEGTFLPLEATSPYSGEQGVLSRVSEKRLETVVWEKDAAEVLSYMKEIHPYEEVAYDLIPLQNPGKLLGLGRYGNIDPIKKADFHMPIAGTYKGNLDDQKVFSKIGVSGGSGGKMVSDAVRLGLDLFISAEFSFHDELLAADYGLTLLDLGHDASERPVLEPLSKLIRDRFPDTSVTIETR